MHTSPAVGATGVNTANTRPIQLMPKETDELTDPPSIATNQCTKPDQMPTGATEGRGVRSKKPSQYIQQIHTGEGTATGVAGDTMLPLGVPKAMMAEITHADCRGDDYAMAACIEARVK